MQKIICTPRAQHTLDLIGAATKTDTPLERLATAAGWNLDEELALHMEWRKGQIANNYANSGICPACRVKPKFSTWNYCIECGRKRSRDYYHRKKREAS